VQPVLPFLSKSSLIIAGQPSYYNDAFLIDSFVRGPDNRYPDSQSLDSRYPGSQGTASRYPNTDSRYPGSQSLADSYSADRYSGSRPAYGNDYALSRPDNGQSRPDYGIARPDYGAQRPDYSSSSAARPDYNGARPGYGQSRPGYDQNDYYRPAQRPFSDNGPPVVPTTSNSGIR